MRRRFRCDQRREAGLYPDEVAPKLNLSMLTKSPNSSKASGLHILGRNLEGNKRCLEALSSCYVSLVDSDAPNRGLSKYLSTLR